MTYIQKIYNFDYLVFAKNSLDLIRDRIKYRGVPSKIFVILFLFIGLETWKEIMIKHFGKKLVTEILESIHLDRIGVSEQYSSAIIRGAVESFVEMEINKKPCTLKVSIISITFFTFFFFFILLLILLK